MADVTLNLRQRNFYIHEKFITLENKEEINWHCIFVYMFTHLFSPHSIMLVAGGTGLDIALSPGPWGIWPAVVCPKGAPPGVPGRDAGDAALDPMKDTGVLQPEGGWEPTWGTEPGFMGGAGEAEADGGLDPTGWPLAATARKILKRLYYFRGT